MNTETWYRFDIELYPPRWWRKNWKAAATLTFAYDGLVRLDVPRVRLSAAAKSASAAQSDVQRACDRWMERQLEVERLREMRSYWVRAGNRNTTDA